MKRIVPSDFYEELPCSVVAVGCALGIDVPEALSGLHSPSLHDDGYLSLKSMNALIRANMAVKRYDYYKRGERPALRDFAHGHIGERAIICLLGHYVYFDGKDYHSFFFNGGDQVVGVWYLQ